MNIFCKVKTKIIKKKIDNSLTNSGINSLPVEILSIILGFINNPRDKNSCVAVCKHWKVLCLSIWKHKTIKRFKHAWWMGMDPFGYSSVAYAHWIDSIHQN